jgi:hypothetical protein
MSLTRRELLAAGAAAWAGRQGTGWKREVQTDEMATGIRRAGYVNWFTLRVPFCSFIGGITFGQRHPKDLWVFHDQPFRYYTAGMDETLEGEGKVFGIRAFYSRPKTPFRSFWGHIMGWTLGQNHPSYILVNGRRVWDSKLHKIDTQKERHTLAFPCWVDEPDDLTIDFVVDRDHTPEAKALAFRYGYLENLGDAGERYYLPGSSAKKEPSPFEKLDAFRFGLFGPGYHPSAQWWADRDLAARAMTVEKLGWKPYQLPDYPLEDIAISPTSMDSWPAPFVDFVSRYCGATLLGAEASDEAIRGLGKRFKGFKLTGAPVEATKRLFQRQPQAKVYWWFEQDNIKDLRKSKEAAGRPDDIVTVLEPFPPSLRGAARAYENGADILQLKNQELPQNNILVAMARGIGRSFEKPWGWGCYTIKTPFPSADFLGQHFLTWYFSGIRYIDSEELELGTFPRILDQDLAFYRAIRFYGLHPRIGTPVVRIGVLFSKDDTDWVIPYTPFGYKDTFRRYIEYDHKTQTLTTKPVADLELKPGLWDKPPWLRAIAMDEKASAAKNRGYDLLDVFFPKYGDAFTARFDRMLTGTPHGPVDFLCAERITPATLEEYHLLVVLTRPSFRPEVEAKLKGAVEKGAVLVRADEASRPRLAELGSKVNMVSFLPAGDQIEYVVNRKEEGLLITVFNHAAIPVGSDRVGEQRVRPPEPLVSEVKGPWEGTIRVHLERAGWPAGRACELSEVEGVDGEAYERVLAGTGTFRLRKLEGPEAKVRIGKRAEFVVAPPGKAEAVFFGR